MSGYNLLVDTGDSVSRALLSAGILYNNINGIIITHFHPDHFSGFASLIVQMKMSRRTEPLSVFVHHTLIEPLKEFLSLSYVFLERLKFPVYFTGFEFDTEIRVSDELRLRARRNTHLDKYDEYDASVSPASSSLLFSSGDKNIFYSGDLGSEEDLYLFRDYKIDLYITEAMHVNVENILKMRKMIIPGKIILTHLSEEDVQDIRGKLDKAGEEGIFVAEDGMNLSVNGYRG